MNIQHLAAAAFMTAIITVSTGVQAQPQTAVTARTANLRAGPATDYPVVAILPAGFALAVQGCLPEYTWCDVIAGESRGWMAAGNIDYYYENSYVPLSSYGAVLGIGALGFVLNDYWGHHYRDRPFFRDRSRWEHRHFAEPHRHFAPDRRPGVITPRGERPGFVAPRGERPGYVAPQGDWRARGERGEWRGPGERGERPHPGAPRAPAPRIEGRAAPQTQVRAASQAQVRAAPQAQVRAAPQVQGQVAPQAQSGATQSNRITHRERRQLNQGGSHAADPPPKPQQ